MKHLISLREQGKEDILEIIKMAQELKTKRKAGELTNYLPNKTLIMLFQKTSTRTRISFETAMTELGGHAIYVDARTTQMSLSDFRDEIRAIMCYGDILMFRAKKANDVELAASFNQIPVIDGCSEKYHPCQALGDVLTMIEHSNGLENIKKIAWLSVKNNVFNTLKTACDKLGIQIATSGTLEETLKNVNYIHTDTWLDMEFFEDGKVKPEYKKEYEQRKKALMPYQLNAKLIDKYAPQAKIMHCMPCHIGYEISRDAIDHPNSIIFDQAENRLHIQKAIIMWLLDQSIPDKSLHNF